MKKILLVVLISVPTFAQNFNKVKVDSLFQVLKTNDKFMEVLRIGKRKIIYTNAIGRTIWQIIKGNY
jgi:hypothetical protein